MLASITPLGERGRHGHWTITVLAFVIGSAGAGALTGAVLGAVGRLVLPAGAEDLRLALLAAGLLAAISLDLSRGGVPGPRRQVDERWLDRYRGWVYGLGYGAQLGAGVATVVTSAATYVTLLAAVLAPGPAGGALVVGCYGAVRGLTPLRAARVQTPAQLLVLHARLERAQGRVARGAGVALGAAAIAALVGGLG